MLLVFNKTGAAVTLAAGNPVRSIPASAAPPARGPAVDVTSELRGLSGANYVALQAQSASLDFEWTGDPEYATTGLTVSGPTVTIANATATNAAIRMAGHVRFTNPAAPDLVSVVADIAMANGAQVIAAQPDMPRKLSVAITDADSSVSAGKITIVGVGARGQAVTEEVTLTGGSATKETANAFATITSATISELAGAVAADHVSIGLNAALALPATQIPTPSGFTVFLAKVDDVPEAVGTVDATAGTIAPTTPANAAHDYDFFYTYSFTPTQAAHTHTAS